MAKKGTAKHAAERDDLAQRLAECAAQSLIVLEGYQLEPHHLECEIRDRIQASGLLEKFREILAMQWRPSATTPTPRIGDVNKALAALREAGLEHWDQVEDPVAFFRELRGGAPTDTAGEIVAALGEAGAKGWDAPLCTLTADPMIAIVKMQMGNGSTSVKRNGIHTPVPVKDVAAYIRRVVEAIG